MFFGVVTIFPDMVRQACEPGVFGRALKQGLIAVEVGNPRDHTLDRHRTVDDRPYGGGPGMVMKPEPLAAAVIDMRRRAPEGSRTVYLSPQGRPIDQALLEERAALPGFVLVCGRYEGVDERFIEHYVDEEWSLGDFVLSGGEIAALAVMDALARLVPGVLGHAESARQDSFADGVLDCPHYTRPEIFEGVSVPAVLLSGNHLEVERWRRERALERTRNRRPDLMSGRES